MTTIYKAGIWIVTGIYKFAAWAFKIFLILASNSLVDSKNYQVMINNFYVILGVVMLFILAFTLLKSMVNPEEQKKGESTIKKIIINLITSALLLILLPTIFSFAFDFQDAIIKENTIGKFFNYGSLEYSGDTPSAVDNVKLIEQGSYKIANGVFTAFFNVDESNCSSIGSADDLSACQEQLVLDTRNSLTELNMNDEITDQSFAQAVSYVEKTGSFSVYSAFADEIPDNIDFNFLLALIGGVILAYIGVSYCFDMAVRSIKLIFYQLIAPIPVLLRVVPEGKLSGVFKNWTKVTLTCYLEVFIRVLVFYFCIYLCNNLLNTDFLKKDIFQFGYIAGTAGRAFILMGLVTFMKQAPKLFSEVTGLDSGNMKLGIKEKLAEGGAFTAGALLGGAATTMVRNAVNARGNIKNKYAESRKAGKSKMASIWDAKGAIGAGALSVAAGTLSGGARAAKAGKGATSVGDMIKSAASGAYKAVEVRNKRANNRSELSSGETGIKGFVKDQWNVGVGHLKNTGTKIAGWAGMKNIEQLKAENRDMDSITSARDSFDSAAESVILKEFAKGKNGLDLGSLGKALDFTDLTILKNNLDKARASGIGVKAAEEAYNKELKNLVYIVEDATLKNNTLWKKQNQSVMAKLSAVRTAAIEFKGAIRNNANLDVVKSANITGLSLSDDVDYQLSREIWVDASGNDVAKGTAGARFDRYDNNIEIDKMEKQIKITKGNNNIEIASREQNQEKKDGK